MPPRHRRRATRRHRIAVLGRRTPAAPGSSGPATSAHPSTNAEAPEPSIPDAGGLGSSGSSAPAPGFPPDRPPAPDAVAGGRPARGASTAGAFASFSGPVRRADAVEVLARGPVGQDGTCWGVRAGTIVDATARALVLDVAGAAVRVEVDEDVRVWRGGRGGLADLRPGRRAIVRVGGDGREVDGRGAGGRAAGGIRADRVWVDIERVAGTITACGRDTVEVDMGPHRGRARVVIPPHALGAVRVRHPRLQPGYLFDVICVGSPDGPVAVRPGTSQPGYRVDDLAGPEPAAPVPGTLHGTVTWFGGLAAPGGAAYPAVDPEGHAGGCADAPAPCVAMPYLSLGSEVVVRNECGGRERPVRVIECGCVAARFCDRCTECGASPRGRVAELTPAAFVGLGGELDAGCFNGTVRPVIGGRAAGW